MTNRICISCDVDISHRGAKARFCGEPCRMWARSRTDKRIRPVDGCVVCKGSLDGKMITAIYCSVSCKNHAMQKRRVRDDAARYLKERDRRIAYATNYAKKNPHVGQATKRKRRAAMVAQGIFRFTSARWLRMQRMHDFRCFYCGEKSPLTMDHVVPLIRGGSHSEGNIVPACMSCNCTKQARFVMEWRLQKSRRVAA